MVGGAESESDLSYCPNQVEDAGIQLKGDGGHTAYYVLRCMLWGAGGWTGSALALPWPR